MHWLPFDEIKGVAGKFSFSQNRFNLSFKYGLLRPSFDGLVWIKFVLKQVFVVVMDVRVWYRSGEIVVEISDSFFDVPEAFWEFPGGFVWFFVGPFDKVVNSVVLLGFTDDGLDLGLFQEHVVVWMNSIWEVNNYWGKEIEASIWKVWIYRAQESI